MSTTPAMPETAVQAAVAAHRFGLGEADLATVGTDPRTWLVAQIGPAEPQRGGALATLADGLRSQAQFRREQQQARRAGPAGSMAPDPAVAPAPPARMADPRPSEQVFVEHFRGIVQADLRAHLGTAIGTTRPFAERLALFWANHFTVSMAKASTRGLVGAFEREAIRPHIAGRFETLLAAAVTHGAMLRYLDNDQSVGPNSRVARARLQRAAGDGRPRATGLNENLAREVLELHTLGVAEAAYGQADVTALAAVLTGWRATVGEAGGAGPADGANTTFDPAWHEPGSKRLLGRDYPEGPAGLQAVLQDLARHPATARHVATRLARHFVADEPDAALVDQLAQAYRGSDGDLPTVYRALLEAPQAWAPAPAKLKTPAEFVISSARLLALGDGALNRQPDGGVGLMGQRLQAAPSPAGWPDRAADWLGPDAVWKRVEWATRLGERLGNRVDARALARRSLGPRLSEATAIQIERAADGAQALALLLLSPEFQRR